MSTLAYPSPTFPGPPSVTLEVGDDVGARARARHDAGGPPAAALATTTSSAAC